jgi:hypothetical protein
MPQLKVTLPGEEYVWDWSEILLSEQRAIETELPGMTWDQFILGIEQQRSDPCQVLIWFLRRKAGQNIARVDVDFPIRKLAIEVLPDADPEAPAGSEPASSPAS